MNLSKVGKFGCATMNSTPTSDNCKYSNLLAIANSKLTLGVQLISVRTKVSLLNEMASDMLAGIYM